MMSTMRGFSAVFAVILMGSVPAAKAATETIIYNFGDKYPDDGSRPQGGLLRGKANTFWGTTGAGGANGGGIVFKLTKASVYSRTYDFGSVPADGIGPGAGLIRDKAGNFWGTTTSGGTGGVGTIFKIAPDGTYSTVYNLNPDLGDGSEPSSSLFRDGKGNLWGTTLGGAGNVFKLAPDGTYSVVHTFGLDLTDGSGPRGGVVADKKGNLWGVTIFGGADGRGIVYRISKNGVYSVAHTFGFDSNGDDTPDGSMPFGPLLKDRNGNLWGVTNGGGAGATNFGTVFKIATDGSYSVQHVFGIVDGDGTLPLTALMEDKDGNIWGTTSHGGANARGTVFEIAADGTYSIPYSFTANPGEAFNPRGPLVLGPKNTLLGVTFSGGTNDLGTIYQITP